MRGKKAKALRKMVYGDMSLRGERKYSFFTVVRKFITEKFNKKGERIIEDENKTTLVCKGPRRKYLDLKKEYRRKAVGGLL